MLTAISLIAPVVAFGAGVLLSQKVKDWVRGIPSDIRKQLNQVEQAALAKAQQAVQSK